ncbi:hypothetical protein SEA_PHONEGINGI_34 [Microbacterium phage Phonegingi]|nr:hypothetical protein SEA_PHONEGINGI_34 [Microbacterium phage Phonegingi]
MTGQRRTKRVPATMFDEAFDVVLIEQPNYVDEFAVELDGVVIGYLTSHYTQSERRISGTRLVSRGARFKAWAQRHVGDSTKPLYERPQYDYYMQHRSMSAAIRRLVDENRSK